MAKKTCRCCGVGASRNLFELYGDPEAEPLMVTVKNGLGQEEKISVDEKLRRWLMSKYAAEIDAVIVRLEGEEEEDLDQLVATPGGHRVRVRDTSVRRMHTAAIETASMFEPGDGHGERQTAKRI
jgi:tetrahydromethanopterin S-methyltransferase subunit A